jgi:FkbM family methyltransferase
VIEAYGPALAEGVRLPSRLPDGSWIECDLRDFIERQVYYRGAYEPIEAYLFTRLVRPGWTVVDAGANVGQYTLLAASRVGPTGMVYGFEPVPANFARLEAHLRDNRVTNVRASRLALWHEPGEVRLGLTADAVGNAGLFSVGTSASSMVTAPAEPFDAFAERVGIGRVDLVKMDIEGAEWAALRGMRRTFDRDRPLLLMEVSRYTCGLLGYDPQEFWNLLGESLGYTAWAVNSSAVDWRRLPSAEGVDLAANVLFTPGPLPPEIAAGWTTKSCYRWAKGTDHS